MAVKMTLQYLGAVFTNKCPRCHKGDLFVKKSAYQKGGMEMHEHCPVCGQPTEIEVGFYYGTGYVSYAISIAFLVATFIAWKVLIGMTFAVDDNRMYYWMGSAFTLMLILQPLLMRLSRTLWLSWFVSYEPNWSKKIQTEAKAIVKEDSQG